MTLMAQEAAESATIVKRQILQNRDMCLDLHKLLMQKPVRMIATCARGSSDHAAAYIKYLAEIYLGIPVSSFAPSVGSIYKRPINLKDTLFWLVSQSGESPDLIDSIKWARKNGAFTLAMVNNEDSAAAKEAHFVLPLRAGQEKAVAATKSYIASLSAALQLIGTLAQDTSLLPAFESLPGDLKKSRQLSWETAVSGLAETENLITVGRGLSFGIALEAALKLKETAAIHAEAFSGAEFMHGPMALIKKKYPVIMFKQNDETSFESDKLAHRIEKLGARIYIAEQGSGSKRNLPVISGLHPAAAPIAMIQSFYFLAEKIAIARGCDPDSPALLSKVTRTT